MSMKHGPTLSQLIMSRAILRIVLVIVTLSIIGLLFLLWIELTNPKLLESASADHPRTAFETHCCTTTDHVDGVAGSASEDAGGNWMADVLIFDRGTCDAARLTGPKVSS
jgi:hypothetical protein